MVRNSTVFIFAFDRVLLLQDLKVSSSGGADNCLLLGEAEIFKFSAAVKI